MKTTVVGVTFDGRQEVVATLKSGDELVLVREPTNKYDKNAVAVHIDLNGFAGQQLGYINRVLAEKMSARLSRGVKLSAVVDEVTGGGEGYDYGVKIEIVEPQTSLFN
jgi:single-stranded-DNA-specific exonuclease